jgi:hypothetical protein
VEGDGKAKRKAAAAVKVARSRGTKLYQNLHPKYCEKIERPLGVTIETAELRKSKNTCQLNLICNFPHMPDLVTRAHRYKIPMQSHFSVLTDAQWSHRLVYRL